MATLAEVKFGEFSGQAQSIMRKKNMIIQAAVINCYIAVQYTEKVGQARESRTRGAQSTAK
jgi:hypothetical protein